MWNKLKNKLPSIFSLKNTTDSKNLIDLTINEINEAALKNQQSLDKTLENQKNIIQTLKQYRQESENLYKAAT